MSEAESNPVFNIQRVYLKDASLEQPNSPQIFLEQTAPEVNVSIGVGAQGLAEEVFEVSVTVNVHAHVGDKTVFMVEAKQAGIFDIAKMDSEQLHDLLTVACPQILYPYLRGNVADLINRAGFPPIHLGEINFHVLREQQAEAQAAPEENVTT